MFAAIAGLALAILSSWKIIWWLQFYLSKKIRRFVLVSAYSSNRRQAWERCVQHIFRTYAENFSPIFSERNLLKLLPKNFA